MSVLLVHNLGGYMAEPPEVTTPDDGWDTYVIHPVVEAADEASALEVYAKGDAASFGALYVSEVQAKQLIYGVDSWRLQVTYKGLAQTRLVKWSTQGYAERSSYQLALAPGMGSPGPVDVSEPKVGVTARWISESDPDTSLVGTHVVPAFTPSLPDNVWGTIPDSDAVLNYPSGWVLEKRETENLPGSHIWLVTDYFVYYQVFHPKH